MAVPNSLEKMSIKKKDTENTNRNHTHSPNQIIDFEDTNETINKSREPNVFRFKNNITKDKDYDNHKDAKHISEEYKQNKRPNSNKSDDRKTNGALYSPKQLPRKEKEVYVFKVDSQHYENTQSDLEFVIYIPVNP